MSNIEKNDLTNFENKSEKKEEKSKIKISNDDLSQLNSNYEVNKIEKNIEIKSIKQFKEKESQMKEKIKKLYEEKGVLDSVFLEKNIIENKEEKVK